MTFIQNSPSIDLILLDIYMPNMDGFDFIGILREKGIEIPVILLTGDDTMETETKAFKYGAIDYIKKPVFKENLVYRIHYHLNMIDQISQLKHALGDTKTKVKNLEDKIVDGVRIATELRDIETGLHIKRISILAKMIAEVLKHKSLYDIDDEFIDYIEKATPFHDIGKIAIEDSILKKPGKLSVDEFEQMKKHAVLGQQAIQKLGETSPESFFSMAEEIALYHHEKWDGSGYPIGLKKTNIPLSARIVAVADVYDALVSKRIYKSAMTHDDAIKIILNDSGKHFDPTIVDAFISIHEDIEQVMQAWMDPS
jgi:putative two-component system response regulator